MKALQKQQSAGTAAVKKLRIKKLQQGDTFMINSKTLPTGQFYLEYPSGVIQLAALISSKKDFEIIKELTREENISLRKAYNLD